MQGLCVLYDIHIFFLSYISMRSYYQHIIEYTEKAFFFCHDQFYLLAHSLRLNLNFDSHVILIFSVLVYLVYLLVLYFYISK